MGNRPAEGYSTPTYLLLSLVLSIFAVAPLLYPGYFQTHSGLAPVWNVADLRANLGQWNWTPHLGLNFGPQHSDGLLPYYVAALLPLEPVAAVKVMMGLSGLLGSAGMFLWLRGWLGRPGALGAALIYTYLPFHLATLYVRGAWGEALWWGLLPLALALLDLRFTSKGLAARLLLSLLLWILLGLSQLGLTLWGFIFAAFFVLTTQPRRTGWSLGAALFGVMGAGALTSAIYAPAPGVALAHHFSDHFLYPFQLLSAQWGFGPSRPGWNDELSFQLGLAAVGLTSLSLALFLKQRSSGQAHQISRGFYFFIGAALVLIVLQFGFTDWLWQLPLLPDFTLAQTLTYPWQLLGLAGLCLSVVAGMAWWLDASQLTHWPTLGTMIIFITLSSYPYLHPRFIKLEPELLAGPQAQLGPAQLALLGHHFSVDSTSYTPGLTSETTTIPLVAYGLPQANQFLRLNVTWQPWQPFNQDWKVFVHLVDAQNTVLAQFDGQPKQGLYPTSRWIPGELIEDSYPLTIPADILPGPYRVFLGLYNEASGARLPVPGDAEGKVILDVK